MIRVIIELCPHGDESNPETISVMRISNQGKLAMDYRNLYHYRYEGYYYDHVDKEVREISGNVIHNRLNSVWVLIKEIINSISVI